MDSNIKKTEIYIPLLNEGVPVFRPTRGEIIAGNTFKVLPSPDYDPEVEEWEFPPGTIVKCRVEVREGKRLLIAREYG